MEVKEKEETQQIKEKDTMQKNTILGNKVKIAI